MSGQRESGQEAAITRTEILLHQAADFVPAERAPEGLALRAMARWESAGQDCSPGLKRNFVPVISLGLAGFALLCLLPRPGSDGLPALANTLTLETAAAWPAWNQLDAFSSVQSLTEAEQPRSFRHNASKGRLVCLARHAYSHRAARAQTPPKAIWTVETVQTRQVGVFYSVLTMEGDASTQDAPDAPPVLLYPAILSVPMQSQVTTCQAPSVSPFPVPPPMRIDSMPQIVEPTYPEPNTPDPNEEKTQP